MTEHSKDDYALHFDKDGVAIGPFEHFANDDNAEIYIKIGKWEITNKDMAPGLLKVLCDGAEIPYLMRVKVEFAHDSTPKLVVETRLADLE